MNEELEQLKQSGKKEFIHRALLAGFTTEQAEFLWVEIEDKAFIRSNFGGLF